MLRHAAPMLRTPWGRHCSSLTGITQRALLRPQRAIAQLHTQCCSAHASAATPAAAASASAPSTAASAASPAGVRVRYAPSPTGSVHLGGLRTALYNYLFAKKQHPAAASASASAAVTPSSSAASSAGKFLLRIEDTDQKRLVPGAVDELLKALRWAGMEHDEGPGASTQGDCGPYVQSERLPLYQQHVQTLLDSGHAYPCFCSAERLSDLRELQTKKGLTSMYDRLCLGMEDDERAERMRDAKENGTPYVIRMKIPHGSTTVKDIIRGQVTFPNKTLDDQVLLKSDGFPTYHLACVVDDHLMRITHVIRGDEWLTSTPKHVLLYKALGWDVPHFAHLPLLLKPDGTKLSKRHADASLEYYISRGYLPEAVVNFVAFLGWNPGTTQEVFTMQQLIEAFSLERIQKAGAVVNLDKLNWFNQQHLQRMADTRLDELVALVRPRLLEFHQSSASSSASPSAPTASAADLTDEAYLRRIVRSLAPHVTHVQDFVTQSLFYFRVPVYFEGADEKTVQLREKLYTSAEAKDLNKRLLDSTISVLTSLPDASFEPAAPSPTAASGAATPAASSSPAAAPSLHASLTRVCTDLGVKQKSFFLLLRYVLTGSESGPSISSMIATLGRQRTLHRLCNADAYTPM